MVYWTLVEVGALEMYVLGSIAWPPARTLNPGLLPELSWAVWPQQAVVEVLYLCCFKSRTERRHFLLLFNTIFLIFLMTEGSRTFSILLASY